MHSRIAVLDIGIVGADGYIHKGCCYVIIAIRVAVLCCQTGIGRMIGSGIGTADIFPVLYHTGRCFLNNRIRYADRETRDLNCRISVVVPFTSLSGSVPVARAFSRSSEPRFMLVMVAVTSVAPTT